MKWSGYSRKAFYKAAVVATESEERADLREVLRLRPVNNGLNLMGVTGDPTLAYHMT
jgi:hypothetical protein